MGTENGTLILGAVAYDPKVVTIWEGFKAYFARHDLPFDYLLYSNYERRVEDLFAGHIHVAWNSPLAWVRTERLAAAQGQSVQAVAMHDTDCDLASVIIVRTDSPIHSISDLKGHVVAVGAADSPQATLIPLEYLAGQGLQPDADFHVQRHDVLVGKHGDHIGGERDAAKSLIDGGADAACMIESNYQLFITDGTLPTGATRILTRTSTFDHCNFTVTSAAPQALIEKFRALLFGMSYLDPEVQPLFDLEGLKEWRVGRVDGYRALKTAVDEFNFYSPDGKIMSSDYR